MAEATWGTGSDNSDFYTQQVGKLSNDNSNYRIKATAAALRRSLLDNSTAMNVGDKTSFGVNKGEGQGHTYNPRGASYNPELKNDPIYQNNNPYLGGTPGGPGGGGNTERSVTDPTGVAIRDMVFEATAGQSGDTKLNTIYDLLKEHNVDSDQASTYFPNYSADAIQAQYDRIAALRNQSPSNYTDAQVEAIISGSNLTGDDFEAKIQKAAETYGIPADQLARLGY